MLAARWLKTLCQTYREVKKKFGKELELRRVAKSYERQQVKIAEK